MARQLNFYPHEYKRREGILTLVRVEPYIRLSHGPGQTIHVQNGLLFDTGGHPLDKKDAPDWLWDELEEIDPLIRREVGLVNDKNSPVG